MAALNPYLNFSGNCEEAFDFYKSVFGGEFLALMRFNEVPAEAMAEGPPITGSEDKKIMHVSLPIGHGTVLMGSDRPAAMGPTTSGNNFYISINAESEDEATRLFNGLSAGGQVTMPLAKAFWNAYFGMFTDKFGIQWMVNYEYNQQQS
jgi:PhnB protein